MILLMSREDSAVDDSMSLNNSLRIMIRCCEMFFSVRVESEQKTSCVEL